MSRRKKKIELRNRTTNYLKGKEWNAVNDALGNRIMCIGNQEKLSDIVHELNSENNFDDEDTRDDGLYEALRICEYHSSYAIWAEY